MALTFDRTRVDTIAAIATASAEAGIGIIRISGEDAFSVVEKIFRSPKGKISVDDWKTMTIHYGFIVDPDSVKEKESFEPQSPAIVDEVLVSVIKKPHSYTTEDVVEINTHGGVYVEQRVLELVLNHGARLADPGEFTKRAFLGGRIDLSRAEAVMDLIQSQNEFSRKTSLAQLEGSVEREVRSLRHEIIYEIAFIESALDDPENYSLDGYPEKLSGICQSLVGRLDQLLRFSQDGSLLKEGIDTAIVGKPNAGKSSLLNYLYGSDRAIVTNIAGTTRDTLEERVKIGDVILNLTDTAGIHETEDTVEKIGVDRARAALSRAQLVLFVLDGDAGIEREDEDIARLIRSQEEEKKCIVLINKSDLGQKIGEEDVRRLMQDPASDSDHSWNTIVGSLQTLDGMEELKNTITSLFHLGQIKNTNEVFLSNVRQRSLAEEARDSLGMVLTSIENGMSEDFFSIDLRNAYTALGLIIGEEVEDDLVTEIFTKFCLGK